MMLALGRYGIALTFGMARQKKKNMDTMALRGRR
jgi:hypothetical protein